eukprot:5864000-Amphidinium_carterae.1
MQNVLIATAQSAGSLKHTAKLADFLLTAPNSHADIVAVATHSHLSYKSDVCSFGHIMLQTFCPWAVASQGTQQEEVATWVSREWKKTDDCVTETGAQDIGFFAGAQLVIEERRRTYQETWTCCLDNIVKPASDRGALRSELMNLAVEATGFSEEQRAQVEANHDTCLDEAQSDVAETLHSQRDL